MTLLLARVEVDGRQMDVRVAQDRVVEMAERLHPKRDEQVVDARGGALLPGLHDHHLHLLSLAAADASVDCGPPSVSTAEALAAVLQAAASRRRRGAWIRGTGYTERVAGPLDRDVLDRLVRDRPVRVQHRSGALWVLNTAALVAARLDDVDDPDVERDADGRLTGRLWRYDARLRARIATDVPDLAAVGTRLSALGVTGVTDATPDLDAHALSALARARQTGALPQDLLLLGGPDGLDPSPGIAVGARKILLRDHDLPGLDELTDVIAAAHGGRRAVAVHCVTRESLLLTLLALEAAGPLPGDRVEHAAVVPPEARKLLAALGVRVVTQPSFVALRGDDYLADVEADDVAHLYPYASLLAAGVPVAASSDAPYGDVDPWRTIAAAAVRRTRCGVVLGTDERVPAGTALAGLLSPLDDPGGPPRRVHQGGPADLCLLDEPLEKALREPDAGHVRLVLQGGRVTAGG